MRAIVCGQEITPDVRAEWLAERRRGLGASESAAALGLSLYESPLEVYLRKTGALPEREETAAMRLGTLMEPVLAALYAERTGRAIGRAIGRTQVFARDEFAQPWGTLRLSATLDAVTDCGRVVELKTVGLRNRAYLDELGDEGTDELPTPWLVQVQQQLMVCMAEVADVAVLIGGQEFRVYEVRPDRRLWDTMVAGLARFWERVERRMPPAVDAARDGRFLAALWPEVSGVCELDAEATRAAACYDELGATIRAMEKLREEYRTQVLAAMGPAARAIAPGVGLLSRRVVSVDAATVERKAYSYVDLRLKKARASDGQGSE